MRKVISGILAIICIDIVFGAYMAMDWQSDIATGSSPDYQTDPADEPTKPQSLEISREPEATSESENRDLTRTDKLRSHLLGRVSHKSPTYIAKLNLRRDNKELRSPVGVKFQDVTILYAAYKPVEFRADKELISVDRPDNPPDQEAKAPRKAANRSFIDRALPIVKKPYDWIKGLGSKLY